MAAAHDSIAAPLGELISTHRNATKSRVLVFGTGVVCLIGGAFLAAAPWAFPDPRFGTTESTITSVVGALIGLLGIKLLWAFIASRGRVVELFKDGLVESKAGRRTIVPFANVETIQSQRVTYNAAGGAVKTSAETHVLRLTDGTTVRVDNGLEGIVGLGTRLEESVASHVGAKVRAQLKQGLAVSFGPVTLTQQGVTIGNAAAEYRELAGVDVRFGQVCFLKQGSASPWRRVQYARLLNAQAMLAVLRERLASRSW
jgi:Family of unknown function (DUF6585)